MSGIAIVGGGVSGVALARALDKLNKSYVIYEARNVGATWAAVPPDLKVLSPWWTNILDVTDLFKFNPLGKPAARKYLAHLYRVAKKLRGNVQENCNIIKIEKVNDGAQWRLVSERGDVYCHDQIVLATGYFFSPALPQPMFKHDNSVAIIHSSSIKDYADLNLLVNHRDPLLVVGGRVTAGQLMLELWRRNISFDLCVRSDITFRRHGLVALLREAVYFFGRRFVR